MSQAKVLSPPAMTVVMRLNNCLNGELDISKSLIASKIQKKLIGCQINNEMKWNITAFDLANPSPSNKVGNQLNQDYENIYFTIARICISCIKQQCFAILKDNHDSCVTRLTQIVLVNNDVEVNSISDYPLYINDITFDVNMNIIGKQVQHIIHQLFISSVPHNTTDINDDRVASSKSFLVHAGDKSGFNSLLFRILEKKIYKDAKILVENIWTSDLFNSKENAQINILHARLQKALVMQPCIIVLQDIDVMLSNENSEMSYKLFEIIKDFLTCINSWGSFYRVLLIARLRGVPTKIMKNQLNTFDNILNLDVPSATIRFSAVEKLLELTPHELTPNGIQSSWKVLNYFVQLTAGQALREALYCVYESLVSYEQSSVIKSLTKHTETIFIQKHVEQQVQEIVVWPRMYSSIYSHFLEYTHHLHLQQQQQQQQQNSITFEKYKNTKSFVVTGILLYGPSGSGKTMFLKQINKVLSCQMLNIHISELVRGEIGTGENNLRKIFSEAKRLAPCIITIDEFDSIFTSNKDDGISGNDVGFTLSSTLSGCFDDLVIWNKFSGFENQVTVIAATNKPWLVDKVFLRTGRFDKCVYMGQLDINDQKQFLINYSNGLFIENSFEMKTILNYTMECSIAELEYFTRSLLNDHMKLLDHIKNNNNNNEHKLLLQDTCKNLLEKRKKFGNNISNSTTYNEWYSNLF